MPFLIDASSSMLFPNNEPYNKLSFSIDATAALIYLMRGQRDAFGVSLFSDEMDFYAPAKSSLPHQRYILVILKNHYRKNTLQIKKRNGHFKNVRSISSSVEKEIFGYFIYRFYGA